MFQTTLVNPWISSLQNEHSELLQKYSQVCQYVHYLSDVIKQLEKKINEMIAKHERNKDKVPKKCKFFDTGFCKNRETVHFCIQQRFVRSILILENALTLKDVQKDILDNADTGRRNAVSIIKVVCTFIVTL